MASFSYNYAIIIHSLIRLTITQSLRKDDLPQACPRYPAKDCQGPFTIRPSENGRHECRDKHSAAVVGCLKACQENICCKGFSLLQAGICDISERKHHHFVKETSETVKMVAQCGGCLSSPCQHSGSCVSFPYGFSCMCQPGYTGVLCETNVDECESSPCNKGRCMDNADGYTCLCVPGYTGTYCDQDVDECASYPCYGASTCEDQVNSFSCTCAPGYTGILCITDIDECASLPCANDGSCIDLVNGYRCQCSEIHVGLNCESDICNGCNNEGNCVLDNSLPLCECQTGFYGSNCEQDSGHIYVPPELTVQNIMNIGDWGSYETCPTGSYAAGIQLKTDGPAGMYDDTSVNAIRLWCLRLTSLTVEGSITSSVMNFGAELTVTMCPAHFWIVSFKFLAEPDQGSLGDNTAGNGLQVKCRGPGVMGTDYNVLEQLLGFADSYWTAWSNECPHGSAVCALQTRVQPYQGQNSWGIDIDDAAVSDVRMQCCVL